MLKMGKGLHKVFKAIVNEILKVLSILGESGSGFYYFIPEPRNVSEVTRLSEDINKSWLNATLKDIKILINNHNFSVQGPEKGETVTPCMDAYEEKL